MTLLHKISCKHVYNEHGTACIEFTYGPQWVVIDSYTPHSTPWDCYGNKWTRERGQVLKSAGIDYVLPVKHRRTIGPRGTGPGGRVRLGDDMQPSTYSIAVPVEQVTGAREAIAAFEREVTDWLNRSGPEPAAIRGW